MLIQPMCVDTALHLHHSLWVVIFTLTPTTYKMRRGRGARTGRIEQEIYLAYQRRSPCCTRKYKSSHHRT